MLWINNNAKGNNKKQKIPGTHMGSGSGGKEKGGGVDSQVTAINCYDASTIVVLVVWEKSIKIELH